MKKIYRILLVGFLVGILIPGCAQENPMDGQEETIVSPTVDLSIELPTETPAPPVVILLAGPEGDPSALSNVGAQVESFAARQGMIFEHRQILTFESAPENLQLVVVLPPVNDLQALAASLPSTKFVAVSVPELSSAGNLTAIGGGQSSENQAFLAGYIAAVQSDDWRVGVISLGDENGRNYRLAFLSGAVYFCGFCNPYYPPFYEYPLFVEVPPGAGEDILRQAADTLITQGVNTIHLAPGVETDSLFSYLAGNNLRFVGTDAPPAGLEGYWIASVIAGGEVDLIQVFSGVINGQTEFNSSSSVEISFTGLSEVRLAHYLEILARLENGEIDPLGGVIE